MRVISNIGRCIVFLKLGHVGSSSNKLIEWGGGASCLVAKLAVKIPYTKHTQPSCESVMQVLRELQLRYLIFKSQLPLVMNCMMLTLHAPATKK